MEGYNEIVAENEGKDEVTVVITSDTEVPTIDSSSPYMTPMTSFADSDVESKFEDEEYETMENRNRTRYLFVWCILFICLVGILIASLTVPKLKHTLIWGLELWKWTVFVLDILYGWSMCSSLFLTPGLVIAMMCQKEVHSYLVYRMGKSVSALIWLGSILLAWVLLIHQGMERPKHATKILDHVTKALVGCLVGAAVWFVKSFLINLLSFSIQHGRFIDRIQKVSFYQKVVTQLSGSPRKKAVLFTRTMSRKEKSEKSGEQKDVIDVRKRHKMKTLSSIMYEIILFVIKLLLGILFVPIQFVIIFLVGIFVRIEDVEPVDVDTVRPVKAKDAYKNIRKVAASNSKHIIQEDDLLHFMLREDVERLFLLFPRARETKSIEESSLKNWLVEYYKEYKELKHSLNYTRRAIEKLNTLASGIAIVIGIIVWCMIMGFLTTQVLVLIFSQIALAAFMFGNTAKTLFEAIIFVFIMHPFDVGDQCMIDDKQMLVEEINILHTTFCLNEMQKIFYPNAVLLGKPILNSFRNPEMEDSVSFNIDLSTSAATIYDLELEMKRYIEHNRRHWHSKHSVVVKDIDNTGNLKMTLNVSHNINFQNSWKKSSRRSKLILDLKKILDKLHFNYRLPQEVHVKYV